MVGVTPWPYNEKPAGFALPDLGLTAEQTDQIAERIWGYLVAGRDDPGTFADIHYDDWPLTREQLIEIFEVARDARVRQQAQWADGEVRTNIDLAFDDLNAAGIVARKDFTCCGTCGAAEIDDERDDSRHWNGYVFFHQQDTESLADSGNVYLSYGVFVPEDFDEQAYERLSQQEKQAFYTSAVREFVNAEVLPRLAARGLDAQWNNDLGKRIFVRDVQWYARLDPAP